MGQREFGPVELITTAFDRQEVPTEVIRALTRVPHRAAKILDVVIVTREFDNGLVFTEYEEARTEQGLPELELEAIGLTAEEDALALAEELEPGTSALIVALEPVWVRDLATAFGEGGGMVIGHSWIPAAVVNEIADVAIR